MNNNPSPGNKAGGLTTILEKSLGAAAKGGVTNLCGVYNYAERIDTRGFVFMDSPGYDPCSITGQVASGSNIVTFTTGRGSCYGCKPAPSLKLATNTSMFNHMEEDMDINCGEVLDEDLSIEEMGERIFEKIIKSTTSIGILRNIPLIPHNFAIKLENFASYKVCLIIVCHRFKFRFFATKHRR